MSVNAINSSNKENYLGKDGYSVIMTSAPWCGYCKIMKPIYEKLSGDETFSNIGFYSMDRDEERELIADLGFDSQTIPRFFVAKVEGGKVTETTELGGSQPVNELSQGITDVVSMTNPELINKPVEQPKEDSGDTRHSVAVIGAGPSGLTAAIYTSRAQLRTDIYTGSQPGGQLTTTTEIENFPGAWSDQTLKGEMGPALMQRIQKQAEHFGATSISAEVSAVQSVGTEDAPRFKVTDSVGNAKEYDAVIIASGASARYLGLENEERLVGKGYHSCATCDGFFYKDREIVVVGGGDSAMEEANFLTKFASKVYLVHRSENFRASKVMLERAKNNPKIEFLTFQNVKEMVGEDKLEHVILEHSETKEIRKLDVDAVFVAIGHIPNSGFVDNVLDMDTNKYLIPQYRVTPSERVSEYDMGTKIDGIFVAGDVEDTTYRQAITAAGDGCRAAMNAEKWIEATHS